MSRISPPSALNGQKCAPFKQRQIASICKEYVPPRFLPIIPPVVVTLRQSIDYVFRFRYEIFSKALLLCFVKSKPPEQYCPTNACKNARADSDPPRGAEAANPPLAGLAFLEFYWINC